MNEGAEVQTGSINWCDIPGSNHFFFLETYSSGSLNHVDDKSGTINMRLFFQITQHFTMYLRS